MGSGGRTASGRITSFKVGAFKYGRLYRFIDFWRRLQSDAFVLRVEKDAFRTSTISLLFYQTGFLSFCILPDGYCVGEKLVSAGNLMALTSSTSLGVSAGYALELKLIPDGAFVFNLELWPTKGAQFCRSAGTFAILLSKRNGFVTLKLRSGWKIVVSDKCYATVGISPNYKQIYNVTRKAGTSRNLGRRPTVRGVAMNAIDHPHGGGRGKTSGGPRPRSP